MSATCPECGVTFPGGQRGGHCRGGAYGGCCQTFSSDGAFDHHRVGPQSARSCLDVTVVTAIRASVREDGTTTANDWRPLVPSWVDKRCVGAVVYALTQADVMLPTGEYDWCDDTSSRNRGKPQPRWSWVEPEAAA